MLKSIHQPTEDLKGEYSKMFSSFNLKASKTNNYQTIEGNYTHELEFTVNVQSGNWLTKNDGNISRIRKQVKETYLKECMNLLKSSEA